VLIGSESKLGLIEDEVGDPVDAMTKVSESSAAQPCLIDDLQGDTPPECSNEACWATDRIHLRPASSVGESSFHTLRNTA
jgi:hypothetical protein